jgi:YHS domain-containing protein
MVFLFIWVLFGVGCAIAAANKKRSVAGWFFLGMLLGPFGLLFILLVQPLSQSEPAASSPPISFRGWSFTTLVIVVGALCFYFAIPSQEKPFSSGLSPSVIQKPVKNRGSDPQSRAYLAAGITKTLRKMDYPTKWTVLGDTHDGSPVLILQCSKFSEKAIQGFIERGILSDIKSHSFERVDLLNGRQNWSYELNQTHIRPLIKGKSYHFSSKLTPAEFDQADKQFYKNHGF